MADVPPHASPGASDSVQSHFDDRAASYAVVTPWVNDPRSLDPIARRVAQVRPPRILELGVGTGAVPDHLRRANLLPETYFGLDVSPAMLRHADGWTPIHGDAARLPFEASSIDLVIARQVFHYFSDPSRVLDEVTRVLTPTGTLIVSQLSPFDNAADMDWWTAAVALRQPLRRQAPSATDLREWLAAKGFAVEEAPEVIGRSSLHSWLKRYPVDTTVEQALTCHYQNAPASVVLERHLERLSDGDIAFSIRWTTLFGRRQSAEPHATAP